MERSLDATGKAGMTGAQSLTTMAALYDVIGELRGQVLGLQAWVRSLIGEDPGGPTHGQK